MAKLQWEKARRPKRPKLTPSRSDPRVRQQAYEGYVSTHQLACFKCGTRKAEWAKVGRNSRGPWAICASCIKSD